MKLKGTYVSKILSFRNRGVQIFSIYSIHAFQKKVTNKWIVQCQELRERG